MSHELTAYLSILNLLKLNELWPYYKKFVNHNHFHNILRLFDALPNLPFTASETMRDYYL